MTIRDDFKRWHSACRACVRMEKARGGTGYFMADFGSIRFRANYALHPNGFIRVCAATRRGTESHVRAGAFEALADAREARIKGGYTYARRSLSLARDLDREAHLWAGFRLP